MTLCELLTKDQGKCSFEDIRELIDDGADINLPGENGRTPLMMSIIFSLNVIIKELVDDGADLYCLDKDGVSAMHWAAGSSNMFAVNCLTSAGVNPEPYDLNVKNSLGRTPIYIAAMYSQPKNVAMLARRGADINLADNFGNTPLHNAAFQMKIGMMQILITHGANINIRNNEGLTPMEKLKQRNPGRYNLCSKELFKLYDRINSVKLDQEDKKEVIKTDYNFDI